MLRWLSEWPIFAPFRMLLRSRSLMSKWFANWPLLIFSASIQARKPPASDDKICWMGRVTKAVLLDIYGVFLFERWVWCCRCLCRHTYEATPLWNAAKYICFSTRCIRKLKVSVFNLIWIEISSCLLGAIKISQETEGDFQVSDLHPPKRKTNFEDTVQTRPVIKPSSLGLLWFSRIVLKNGKWLALTTTRCALFWHRTTTKSSFHNVRVNDFDLLNHKNLQENCNCNRQVCSILKSPMKFKHKQAGR